MRRGARRRMRRHRHGHRHGRDQHRLSGAPAQRRSRRLHRSALRRHAHAADALLFTLRRDVDIRPRDRQRRARARRSVPRRASSTSRRRPIRRSISSTSPRHPRPRARPGIPLVVDNTFAGPHLQRPIDARRGRRAALDDEIAQRPQRRHRRHRHRTRSGHAGRAARRGDHVRHDHRSASVLARPARHPHARHARRARAAERDRHRPAGSNSTRRWPGSASPDCRRIRNSSSRSGRCPAPDR